MHRSVAFRASCAHHTGKVRDGRDMRGANVHLRRMLAAAIAVTLVTAVPVCAVGVSNVVDAVRRNGEYASAVVSHDVMSAYEAVDEPGRLYLTSGASSDADADTNEDESSDDNAASSQRIPQERVKLPWNITATFTLNGPTVSASEIAGASGVVGIRIDLKSEQPKRTADLTPIVAFTIPNRVGNDVTSDEGVLVSAGNSSTLVAMVGKPGEDLTVHTYVTAKNFTMSSLSVAAVESTQSSDTAQESSQDSIQDSSVQIAGIAGNLTSLTDRASNLVDGLTNVGSQRNYELIAQLEQLRDHEKELAETTIAQREQEHQKAFDGYIDAYVGSYTTHLSESIGTSTQLTAILGTAAELNGDTPVAQSVVDLANAVNDVSAAYRHTGAADAVNEVIRTIEQRGTSGLVAELSKRAGEEQQHGAKDYSAGQSQLSSAMIPYSMDFTDAYTARLKELGASAGSAQSLESQAIADVRNNIDGNEKLKTASDKVDDAMRALADASEHTGQASALHQIVLRFADQLNAGDDSTASDGSYASDGSEVTLRGSVGLASAAETSLAGRAEQTRIKAQRKAERAQADAANQQNASDGAMVSLVDDKNAISMDDVMSYAGGLRSSFGAAADATSKNVAKVGGVDSKKSSDGGSADSASGNTENTGKAGDSASFETSLTDALPIAAYGIAGSGNRTLIVPDNSDLIDETVKIATAAEILQQALQKLYPDDSVQLQSSATTQSQYLLAVPVL